MPIRIHDSGTNTSRSTDDGGRAIQKLRICQRKWESSQVPRTWGRRT